jgi:hypothetical protein
VCKQKEKVMITGYPLHCHRFERLTIGFDANVLTASLPEIWGYDAKQMTWCSSAIQMSTHASRE